MYKFNESESLVLESMVNVNRRVNDVAYDREMDSYFESMCLAAEMV